MEAFLSIAGDQRVIAGLSVLLFSFFALGCYIFHEERKSKRDHHEMDGWPQ